MTAPYRPTPLDTSAVALPDALQGLLETLAENTHDVEGDPSARKPNENLKPWRELDEGTRDDDRNIIRRLPYVFAKADLKMVELP